MALTCPTCRTENRDAAKFCKGCGGKLVILPPRSAEEAEALDDAWGATVVGTLEDDPTPWPSPPPPSPRASPRASRPAALQAASVEPPRDTSRPHRRHRAPPRRDRSMFWVLLAAATIVVVMGGLYVYRDQHRTPLLTVVQEPAPAPASPAAGSKSPVLPITGAVTSAEATAPAAPMQAAAPLAAVASAAVAARKPRKAASAVAAPVAPPPVAAAPAVPAAPVPETVAPPPAPADPGQACAGRGFIATSQCLVAQCAKPEFSAHARCDAVRQQQRIDEEKRNPTNAA